MICIPCVETVAAIDPELWPIVALVAVSIPIGILYLVYVSMRWLAVSSWHRLERQEREARREQQRDLQARLEKEIAAAQASVRRLLAIADESRR
jgi:type VI protein secretion system component VasK